MGNLSIIIRYPYNQFIEFTVQSFTYKIQMLQVYPVRVLVVQFTDGIWSDASCPSQISLTPFEFAELC